MPLRLRIVFLIGLVLLASMALGALVAGYQVRRALGAELAAGLGGARQSAVGAFADLPQSDHPAQDLHQIVATFDGNRHVQAVLVDRQGHAEWTSRSDNLDNPPPRWFRYLLNKTPTAMTLQVPMTSAGPGTLILKPTPELDIAAAWAEFLALMSGFAMTAVAGLLLVYLVIGAALRPLTVLALQFKQIGAGNYTARVAETGPPELLQLQQGFNHMAGKLAGTTQRNTMLTDQLAKLQEEERSEIARDLHDEIGPHLFAVNLDAQIIAQLSEAGAHAAIPERVNEIQSSVRHMQRQVRELLGRLRPTQLTEFGFEAAIEDLMRFWKTRQPDIAIDLTLTCEPLTEGMAEVAYRIVQESVNNAVRHGQPRRIGIVVAGSGGGLVVAVDDDGAAIPASFPPAAGGSRLGLIGMRERVEGGGGSLTYGPRPDGSGWTVTAQLGSRSTLRPLPQPVRAGGKQ